MEAELARRNKRTRQFTSASKKTWGDRPFSRGHLYKILSNPVYAGKIAHKGEAFDGQHEAIIDRATWDAVQNRLDENTHERRVRSQAKEPSLLAGLLVDAHGAKLTSSHAVKDGKRYRYYVSNRQRNYGAPPLRLPAYDIEAAVVHGLSAFLQDQTQIAEALASLSPEPSRVNDAFTQASEMLSDLTRSTSQQRAVLLKLVKQVQISELEAAIEIELDALLRQGQTDSYSSHVIRVPISFRQQAGETKLVISGANDKKREPDPALVKAIARGHAWFDDLLSGRAATVH